MSVWAMSREAPGELYKYLKDFHFTKFFFYFGKKGPYMWLKLVFFLPYLCANCVPYNEKYKLW